MNPTQYSMFISWSTIDQVFVVSVPELPGCMAHGETRQEAIAQAEAAIENWLETAREIGREIPEARDLETFETELEEGTEARLEGIDLKKAMVEALPAITPAIIEALAKHLAETGEDIFIMHREGGIRIVSRPKSTSARWWIEKKRTGQKEYMKPPKRGRHLPDPDESQTRP